MRTLLFALLFLISAPIIIAQNVQSDSSKTMEQFVITKQDGTEYIGYILSDDGREVLIESMQLGKLYIPKSEIKSILKITNPKDVVMGEYQSTGPFTTRYAFTTNALPIKKGENYAMVNLYGPEVHFAVSNNLNVGVMTTWILSPFVLALKYSVKTKNPALHFSAGTLIGTTGYINNFKGYGGLHWLCMTAGNRKNNVSLSGGYAYLKTGSTTEYVAPGIYDYGNLGYAKYEKPMTHGPMFSLAGILKIGAKASFVFDSMLGYFTKTEISNEENRYTDFDPATNKAGTVEYRIVKTKTNYTAMFLMPGIRFQHNEKKAFQVSIVGVSIFQNTNTSFAFPQCSWFYKF